MSGRGLYALAPRRRRARAASSHPLAQPCSVAFHFRNKLVEVEIKGRPGTQAILVDVLRLLNSKLPGLDPAEQVLVRKEPVIVAPFLDIPPPARTEHVVIVREEVIDVPGLVSTQQLQLFACGRALRAPASLVSEAFRSAAGSRANASLAPAPPG